MLPVSFFDAHCDTLSCCTHLGWDLGNAPGHTDLCRGAEFAHYAQVFAIFRDGAQSPEDGMLAECERQARVFRQQMSLHKDTVMQCCTAEDLARAAAEHKTAALLSIEGAELLECDPGRLEYARDLGVRLINVTWNRANALSGSNAEERERGLSPQGRDFVRRAWALGILVDVSHLSDPGFWDLADLAEQPLVASHSDSRALCGHQRNLTDDMFRTIRDSGGFVGLNFYTPFIGRSNTLDDIFAHLEHFLEMDGEKTVGFGGDWDGCDRMPGGIRGVQDMVKIYEKMLQRNYSPRLIDDIFYNNLKRVILARV